MTNVVDLSRGLGLGTDALSEHERMREAVALGRELERVAGALEHWNRELKQIDEHLSVMLAKPHTTVEGLKPGYYHIIRFNPGTLATIKPIEGPNGEWRDLDSSVIDLAVEDDLWNDRVMRDRKERRARAEAALERDRKRKAQDRIDEANARAASLMSTSILVTKDLK